MFRAIYRIGVKLAEILRLYETRTVRYLELFNKYVDDADVVVDLGSGTGLFSKMLSSKVKLLIALDIKSEYLKRIDEQYVERVCADAQHLPFRKKSVNAVLAISLLEHLPSPEMCIHEASKILLEKGMLIVQLPNLLYYIEPHTKFPMLLLPTRLKEHVRKMINYEYINFECTINRIWKHVPTTLRLVEKRPIYHRIKTPPWPPAWILVYKKSIDQSTPLIFMKLRE